MRRKYKKKGVYKVNERKSSVTSAKKSGSGCLCPGDEQENGPKSSHCVILPRIRVIKWCLSALKRVSNDNKKRKWARFVYIIIFWYCFLCTGFIWCFQRILTCFSGWRRRIALDSQVKFAMELLWTKAFENEICDFSVAVCTTTNMLCDINVVFIFSFFYIYDFF